MMEEVYGKPEMKILKEGDGKFIPLRG